MLISKILDSYSFVSKSNIQIKLNYTRQYVDVINVYIFISLVQNFAPPYILYIDVTKYIKEIFKKKKTITSLCNMLSTRFKKYIHISKSIEHFNTFDKSAIRNRLFLIARYNMIKYYSFIRTIR